MEPWHMPLPLLPVAITAHSAGDDDKLGTALARITAEDPTLRIEHPEETGQIVLWTLGEAHADLIVDRIKTRYGVAVDATEMRASLRETFAAPASGNGRLVKQSGGHGQYAVVDISVEPLPAGSGFEFVDKIVGGAVPRNYIPSVEKGVRQQMALGVAAGYPVVDLRVTLLDGKFHSVDSSDMAFQSAGALALKDAATRTTINLLEPIVTLTVDVPDDHVGAVIADVSTRRGQIRGTTSLPGGRSQVVADVPEVEISRYAIDIRSITHGTGDFTRESAGYAALPASLAKKLIDG
jgi:elongation factor G